MSKRKIKVNKKVKLIALVLVVLAIATTLFFVFGGNKNENTSSKNNKKGESKPVKVEEKINIIDTTSNKRPFAIMINNLAVARQMHSGLQDAYIIYEMIVEGGITRYMAIFESDKQVDKIGPVRSSRHYYLDYVKENDAIYVHNGYSPQAGADFGNLGIDRIEAEAPKTGIRWNPKGLAREHTLFTNTELLNKNGVGKKRTELNKNVGRLLKYSAKSVELDKKTGAIIANNITIPYSKGTTTSYTYDPENKVYKRFVNGTAHTDYITKNQYTFKNIITYKVKNNNIVSPDGYNGRQEIHNIGSGTGYYISEGYAVPIKWSKESRTAQTKYTYEDGTELKVNDGNTFIQIQPADRELTIAE
ncbi:MAG: DUF3048 domain-containing protein [Bacilli bacterium]|nr:DUF3048 domain-containing protein [Bacilli bacterium]